MSFFFRKYCCRCHNCKTETIMQTLSDIKLSHEILAFVLSLTSLMIVGFEKEQVFMDCLDSSFKLDQFQLNSLDLFLFSNRIPIFSSNPNFPLKI
uniref:Uncharacterized protein n=1 Tax=Arundo donax TaxID=35708 RepID=A0A0A9EVS2_ARUDO